MFISRPINFKVNFGSPANTEEGGGGFNLQAIKNSVPHYEKSEPRKLKFVWTKFIVLQAVIIKYSLTKSNHLRDFKIIMSQSTWQGKARQDLADRGGGDSIQTYMRRLSQGSEWKTQTI